MSLTISDARDAAHSAYMDTSKWGQEFIQEWLAPIIAMQEALMVEDVIVQFERMPADMRKMMQAQAPEIYAQIMDQVEQLKARKE